MSIPGLPALPISVTILVPVPALIADLISLFTGFGQSPWGIFQDGLPVISADSVIALDYKQEWSISTAPTEEGGFESYNKVNSPFSARIRFASGGSLANRQDLLDSIEAIAGNTELYDIVTPEVVYPNVTIAAYDYRRTSINGVGLLQVDIRVMEIRETASASFSSTQAPAAANTVSQGTVQPQPYRGTNLGPLTGAGN